MGVLLQERVWLARNALNEYRQRPAELAFLLAVSALIVAGAFWLAQQWVPTQLQRLDDWRLQLAVPLGALLWSITASSRQRAQIGQSWWRARELPKRDMQIWLSLSRCVPLAILWLLLASAAPGEIRLHLLALLALVMAAVGSALAWLPGKSSAHAARITLSEPPRYAVGLSARLPLPYVALTQWSSARWGKKAQIGVALLILTLPGQLNGLIALAAIGTMALLAGLVREFALGLSELPRWHKRLRTLPYRRWDFIVALSVRPAIVALQCAALLLAVGLLVQIDARICMLGCAMVIALAALALTTAMAYRDDAARMQLRTAIALSATVALPIALGPFALLAIFPALWLLLRRALKI